jgi:molybdopterin converting factor small subunit
LAGEGVPVLKTLTMSYFGAFHDAAGLRQESWRSEASTAAELYEEVAARRGFRFDRATLGVALNDCVVGWETEIRDGDSVVFLAPYAGG